MNRRILNPLSSALVALSLFAIACSDDDDKKTSKTDLLTAKTWHITKVELSAAGQTEDITEEYSEGECENDDTTLFHKDGKYEEKAGTVKCYQDEEDFAGTWAWKDGEKRLAISYDNDTYDVRLIDLNANTLKVAYIWEDIAGAELILTYSGQ